MPKVKCVCEYCGASFERWPHEVGARTWCSQSCHMKSMNAELNPTRMCQETRDKLREANSGNGAGKTYKKYYGRHEHRVVAEAMLGRPLRKGEVVHHVNGNKQDNRPENLRVFASQKEHAQEHERLRKAAGGDRREL